MSRLKILSPGAAADQGFRQRFLRESRLAAAVDDPHVIPVHEAGEDDGVLYLAMRYVSGGDARTLLARTGPLPPARAAAIISPVASALDAAHNAGLVHCDVKPTNILIDTGPGRPDHVYLADFGISRTASRAGTALTGTGNFVGTLDYIAPEQIRAQELTGAADQYALACTALELLTGGPPFARSDPMALIAAHLIDPAPAPSSRDARLAASDPVFARALAKEPAARYPACRDFADGLRAALGLAPYAAADPPAEPAPGPGPAPSRSHAPAGRAGPAAAAQEAGPPVAEEPVTARAPESARQPAWPENTGPDSAAIADPATLAPAMPAAGRPDADRFATARVARSGPVAPRRPRRALLLALSAVIAVAATWAGIWGFHRTPEIVFTAAPGNIAAGRYPDAIAIAPDGRTAYVANAADSTVTPITLATGTPRTTIPVGDSPGAIAITPDGRTAYVANYGDNTVTVLR